MIKRKVKSYDEIINKTNCCGFVEPMKRYCGCYILLKEYQSIHKYSYIGVDDDWAWREEWLELPKEKFVEIKE